MLLIVNAFFGSGPVFRRVFAFAEDPVIQLLKSSLNRAEVTDVTPADIVRVIKKMIVTSAL